MEEKTTKIRLFIDMPLKVGSNIDLDATQAHYLKAVMRLSSGNKVIFFNGQDGEWLGQLIDLGKKKATVALQDCLREQDCPPDVWMLFAPLKKTPMDFIAEKATELGATRLWPVFTKNTDVNRVNTDRLRANAIEASEQCRRLTVPEITPPTLLEAALQDWPKDRPLFILDETGEGQPIMDVLSAHIGSAAFLVGPEGGFDAGELKYLRSHPNVTPLSLGKRILRAETAVLAALSCFQAVVGDWRDALKQ